MDVTYRHIPEDSQFMPVLYGNKSVFLDTATLVLRDNTTYLPVNPEMPVSCVYPKHFVLVNAFYLRCDRNYSQISKSVK